MATYQNGDGHQRYNRRRRDHSGSTTAPCPFHPLDFFAVDDVPRRLHVACWRLCLLRLMAVFRIGLVSLGLLVIWQGDAPASWTFRTTTEGGYAVLVLSDFLVSSQLSQVLVAWSS